MPALAGTPTCQLHHVGYAISGALHVLTDAGHELDVHAPALYEIPSGHDAWVIGDDPFVTIDWTSARTWAIRMEGVGEGDIVTILFTDIVESTARLHEMGDHAWREQLVRHHGRMRDSLNAYRGREIKTTGDGLLAVFDRPIRAVRCAEAMAATSSAMGLPIRVGVHTGEVELLGDDARGLAIHTAARVMSLGDADDVMVSSTTRELLEGSGVRFEDAGEHELKGLPGVRRVFRLERGSE
jgi:class 3 adenylate cyclase